MRVRAGWLGLVPLMALVVLCGGSPAMALDLSGFSGQDKRDLVAVIADTDPRPEVATGALDALVSREPGTVEQFLSTGFDRAVAAAQQQLALDTMFVTDVADDYDGQVWPTVHADAVRVLAMPAGQARDVAIRWFAATGFAADKAFDQYWRQVGEAKEAQIAQADRALVAEIAALDPGPVVRQAAASAIGPGGSDRAVADFLGRVWADTARIDLRVYRIHVNGENVGVQDRLQTLTGFAQYAELEQARAVGALADEWAKTTAMAWQAVAAHADSARSYWTGQLGVVQAQAATWQTIAAQAHTGVAAGIDVFAADNAQAWTDEVTRAAERADDWAGLLALARAREQARP